ncbi:hypothetical protein ACS3QZ_15680 [Shimia sp. W99]
MQSQHFIPVFGGNFVALPSVFLKSTLGKVLIFRGKTGNFEKNDIFEKKGLRVPRTNRRTPLTGGAEAHNGTPDGAADLIGREGSERSEAEIIEAADAGCAKKKMALPVDFVSRVLRGSDVF